MMYVIEILKYNFYQRNEDGRYKMEKIRNVDEHLFIKFTRNHRNHRNTKTRERLQLSEICTEEENISRGFDINDVFYVSISGSC